MDRKRIIYFATSSDDSAEIRRSLALQEHHDLFVIFSRGNSEPSKIKRFCKIDRRSSVNFVSRLLNLIKAFLFARHLMHEFQPNLVVAKNFDNLILCLLTKKFSAYDQKVIYEICDIHSIFYKRLGIFLLFIQRLITRYFVDYIMVTSERFISVLGLQNHKVIYWPNFFAGFDERELHHYLSRPQLQFEKRIVYHGKLRDKRSIEILVSFSALRVDLYGMIDVPNYHHSLRDHIQSYVYDRDLPVILRAPCFVWCITGDNLNEKSLLTNRLYDAIAFQCIPVVSEGSYQEEFCKLKEVEHIAINTMTPSTAIEMKLLSYEPKVSKSIDEEFLKQKYWVPSEFLDSKI